MAGNMNNMYTNGEMADMHLMYGLAHCNSREARRLYQEHFPRRQLPTHKMFSSIHRRLSETGTFKPGKVGRSGRPRTTCTAELEEGVLDEIENHPGRSTRELALDFGVSNSIVWKILHEQQLQSYHYQRVQALLPRDYFPRVQLCQWLIQRCRNPHFLNNIIFTDEAKFSRMAILNTHNTHIWAIENPNAISENRHQYQFSINVWAAILGDNIFIRFLPDRLNGENYLHFLTTDLNELLDDVPLNTRNKMWFMQDGAPAHYTIQVREFLNEAYPNRWIGRGAPVAWPARSPDLNPLDFFLWGHLKTLVYDSPVDTIEELRIRIINGIQRIRQTPGIFERVRQSMRRRLDACILNEGKHFENLL